MFRSLPRTRRTLLGAIALVVMSQISGYAWAAPRIVYTGSLQGAGDIVMELENDAKTDGTLTGRYFYPKQGIDIPLSGTEAALFEPKPRSEWKNAGAASTQDEENAAAAANAAAEWHGTRDAAGYRGQWVDSRTGKKRSFNLRLVAKYDPDLLAPSSVQAVTDAISGGVGSGIDMDTDIDPVHAPYETLKLAGHAKPVGNDIGNATVAYRMWRDPRTGFSYPRLTRHPDRQVLNRINHLLEQRHWQMNLAALACMSSVYTDDGSAAGTLGGYDEETVKVTWLSKALMTVTESGSLYCGGAHPNNHFDPYTLDLLRGDYLDWNRIIDAYVRDEQGMRTESPRLIELMKQARDALPAEAKQPLEESDPNGCTDLWPEYMALGIGAPGSLVMYVSGVGHALGVCLGTQANLPFKDLMPFLKPGGQAYLITE